MPRLGRLIVFGLLGFLAVAAGFAQQTSSRRTTSLTAQDYVDIQELYSRYSQGTDYQDAALFASIFTPDGVFKPGPSPEIVGVKAITEWRQQSFVKGGQRRQRLYNSSLILRPTADGATGRGYYALYVVSSKPAILTTTGHYDDEFVKTSEGWRIKKRTVLVDSAAQSPAGALVLSPPHCGQSIVTSDRRSDEVEHNHPRRSRGGRDRTGGLNGIAAEQTAARRSGTQKYAEPFRPLPALRIKPLDVSKWTDKHRELCCEGGRLPRG